ncbi:MAG TPA: permease prefix domain 1-containing protein [Terriglobia bacterium]|nr:permease prefix domain 1-containing protein [Terriglobia bacterium]
MPDWHNLAQERLRPLGLRAPAELDLTVEIAQHLEGHYQELLSGGVAEDEAYERTLAELDDVYRLRAGSERSDVMPKRDAVPAGDTKPGNLMDGFWRDLRYGGRTLRKSPLFALAATCGQVNAAMLLKHFCPSR